MNLSLRFYEALLRPRKRAANALDRIQCERRDRVLVGGMEMRPVVRCTDLREHANDDSEESGDFRHFIPDHSLGSPVYIEP